MNQKGKLTKKKREKRKNKKPVWAVRRKQGIDWRSIFPPLNLKDMREEALRDKVMRWKKKGHKEREKNKNKNKKKTRCQLSRALIM